jgi:hypothetical protein
MGNSSRTDRFRTAGASRLGAAVVACALSWQMGAPIHLLANPEMSCCVKAHDASKCPCRYCTHNRSSAPLLETCGDAGEHPDLAFLAVDVFEPAAAPSPASSTFCALPAASPERRVPQRPVDVPTPPA